MSLHSRILTHGLRRIARLSIFNAKFDDYWRYLYRASPAFNGSLHDPDSNDNLDATALLSPAVTPSWMAE